MEKLWKNVFLEIEIKSKDKVNVFLRKYGSFTPKLTLFIECLSYMPMHTYTKTHAHTYIHTYMYAYFCVCMDYSINDVNFN